jgi:hypothetical protein
VWSQSDDQIENSAKTGDRSSCFFEDDIKVEGSRTKDLSEHFFSDPNTS